MASNNSPLIGHIQYKSVRDNIMYMVEHTHTVCLSHVIFLQKLLKFDKLILFLQALLSDSFAKTEASLREFTMLRAADSKKFLKDCSEISMKKIVLKINY